MSEYLINRALRKSLERHTQELAAMEEERRITVKELAVRSRPFLEKTLEIYGDPKIEHILKEVGAAFDLKMINGYREALAWLLHGGKGKTNADNFMSVVDSPAGTSFGVVDEGYSYVEVIFDHSQNGEYRKIRFRTIFWGEDCATVQPTYADDVVKYGREAGVWDPWGMNHGVVHIHSTDCRYYPSTMDTIAGETGVFAESSPGVSKKGLRMTQYYPTEEYISKSVNSKIQFGNWGKNPERKATLRDCLNRPLYSILWPKDSQGLRGQIFIAPMGSSVEELMRRKKNKQ